MNFYKWLQEKLNKKSVPVSDINSAMIDEYNQLVGDANIREMAFWTAINIITGAISKCEFKVYIRGAEKKGREYHLWNLSPNKNQSATTFIHKLLSKLYCDNECLVIEDGKQLLVADSFMRAPYVLYDDVFTQVTVGDFTFKQSFVQGEVLFFQLNSQDMRQLMDSLYVGYSKILAYAMKSFQKSRGTKGIFNYEAFPLAAEEKKVFDKLMNEGMKTWLEADNGALPLGRGQSWTELTKRTYSEESSRDIRALVDDINDFTAKAFGIPPALLRGDVQDTSAAMDQFLTLCIDPLVVLLQKEINRKRVSPAQYAEGTYMQIDTRKVKHIDLLSVAAPIDKLISSGFFTVNNMLELVGMPRINEAWADAHFMTKNYATVEEILKMIGGE